MSTKKYISLDKLAKYDALLKIKIAADDAAALKSAKDYADSLAGNYESAGSVNTAKQELQGSIDALANGAVAQNTAAIAKLNGDASTTGSVAKVVADSAATLQAAIDAVDTIADANAADIVTMKGQISALEAGTYDDTEVRGLIGANADAIESLEQTHATDKGTLEAAIELKADKTALDEVSAVADAAVAKTVYDAKVEALEVEDTRIEGLVTAEAERAAEVESDFEERIAKMEVFWDTTEDADNVVNKLKEIQDYIAGDETGAAEMAGNIQANTQAIEAMDTAYKAADTTLQNAIDLKADASALETLDGRVEELEGVAATYATKTEVQAVSDALGVYEDAHAGDYTNEQIDAAIKVNTDAIAKLNDTYATDAELDAAIEAEVTRANGAYAAKSLETTVSNLSATVDTKAAQSEVDTISGKVGTLETDMAKAKTDIAANSAAHAANATEIDKKANKATTLAGYGIADAYTSAQTDTAIANAMAQFVECSEEDINGLFQQ